MLQSFVRISLGLCFVCVSYITVAHITTAQAQVDIPMTSKAPIEIEADEALEWQRENKRYIARGNAQVKQGDIILKGNEITAYYDDASDKVTNIQKVTSMGDVTIETPEYKMMGDNAIYDVATAYMIITGENLKAETEGSVLTARDSIEYFVNERKIEILGKAKVIRATEEIRAEKMTAYLAEDENGKLALTKVIAKGNVHVIRGEEIVMGNDGVYDLTEGHVVLIGNVKLLQGKNWLTGEKALVNLKTGISQIFAKKTKKGTGRVRGIFYPENK